MIQQHEYSLAKRGKWICPECGRKTFVCYVDANGNVLDESVGKCDRADNCAYHKPPREFFEEQKLMGVGVPHRRHQPMFKPQPQPSYIDPQLFKQSVMATQNHRNYLISFLTQVFDVRLLKQMIADYYIGTSKHWEASTVFWQIDRFGRVHAGKIMQYDPDNGKRIKVPFSRITWVHTAMSLNDFKLSQCLFGEHLLKRYPDKYVAIVESEKTAIIASGVFGDCIALACGGCGNLTAKMCEPLRGRDVLLFPDNGKFDEWSDKGKQLRYIFQRLRIADIMEREALNVGDDIGDLFLQQYPEWKRQSVENIVIDLGFHEL